MPDQDPPKGKRTETVVRQYDADGELVLEQTTTTVTITPKADETGHPGMYL